MKFWKQAEALGLKESEDQDLGQFISEFQITGAMLAGALAGVAEGRGFCHAAFTVSGVIAFIEATSPLHRYQLSTAADADTITITT